MADMSNLIKLAVDGYKGTVQKYSVDESQDVLRNALIEANNGKTTFDYRDIRDGKCNGLFAIVEQILDQTISTGLMEDDYFNSLVDYRNIAAGDMNEFVVKDDSLFVVAKAADGIQGVRRQRLGGATTQSIPTEVHIVRIYDDLRRILAGRIDFNEMIDRVGKSFRRQLLDEVYALWSAASIGGTTFFPAAGVWSESNFLTLVEHVEAAAGGKQATIVGTKAALRNLMPSIVSDSAKEDLYTMGYMGKFYGTPVVATPQRHKFGTTDFVFNDKVINIIAGDEKPVKVVREGDPLIIMRNAEDNNDLTQEYVYAERYGMGIVTSGKNTGIGRYTLS